MKVVIIYGTERKGCTYHIARNIVEKIREAELTEFFLPKDCPDYCVSCFRCFTEENNVCHQSTAAVSILNAMLAADIIILTSPVYSFHLSGQMKTFLDHFANIWMVHRPRKEMFLKQGIVIATASGPVYHKTLKEMKDSLDFWGVSKTYSIGAALMETRWDHVPAHVKKKLDRKTDRALKHIQKRFKKIHPCFRVRKWFAISRLMQKYIKMNPPDVAYWEEQGWTKKERPWKQKI